MLRVGRPAEYGPKAPCRSSVSSLHCVNTHQSGGVVQGLVGGSREEAFNDRACASGCRSWRDHARRACADCRLRCRLPDGGTTATRRVTRVPRLRPTPRPNSSTLPFTGSDVAGLAVDRCRCGTGRRGHGAPLEADSRHRLSGRFEARKTSDRCVAAGSAGRNVASGLRVAVRRDRTGRVDAGGAPGRLRTRWRTMSGDGGGGVDPGAGVVRQREPGWPRVDAPLVARGAARGAPRARRRRSSTSRRPGRSAVPSRRSCRCSARSTSTCTRCGSSSRRARWRVG